MSQTSETTERAIDWAIRVNEPGFDDWDSFIAWLEETPRNNKAYEAVLAAADTAEPALPAQAMPAGSVAPSTDRRGGRRWPVFGGAGLAACAAVLIVWATAQPRKDLYLIQTAPGMHRQLDVPGVSIAINGDTRLWLDRRNPRVATIERGEALFDVRHDADHPFLVHVGTVELRDVGTRFDVTSADRRIRVAVAEGAVVLNPDREAIRVAAGKQLALGGDDGDAARLSPAQATAVGSWRDGRFPYVDAPISTIAADLTRSTGVAFAVDPAVAADRFTGVISFTGDREALVAELGPLLGVGIRRDHGRWVIGQVRPDR